MLIEEAARGLDARERRVVRMRFVDGLLQREIAERIGVSQVHVSRLLRGAVGRMRDQARDDAGDHAADGGDPIGHAEGPVRPLVG